MARLARGHRPTNEPAPGDEPSDEALVVRARGDPHAFAPLYARYVDPIYRYCFRRLGSKEAAEDATSLVFLKAISGLPGYRTGSTFRSWLFAIAHNVIADDLRARRPARPLVAAIHVAGAEPGPEATALQNEAGQTVHDLLAQLPPDQAHLVALRLSGLIGAEIAGVLGSNPGAVRVAHHRAVARLRALFGDSEEAIDA
jgi:RNA polymerase sigma-70 factor (ECF subfamily)